MTMEWKHPNYYKEMNKIRKQHERKLAVEDSKRDIAIGERIKVKNLSPAVKRLLKK